MRRLLLIACAFGTLAAAAQVPDNDLRPEQKEQYRRLASEFVAPCCWREALTFHRSPQADQARLELVELIRAGHSDAQIRDKFVANYGEAILLTPPGGKAQWLFVVPIVLTLVALGLGAWFLAVALKRGHRHAPDSEPPSVNV